MIQGIINKIKYLYYNSSYEGKVKYLRSLGCVIGEHTRLNCKTNAFGTEPYLIEVGDHCLFADGIHIITHDGGVSVLNNLKIFDTPMNKMKRVKIGDNVYIGLGASVMPGVTIGNNCIIGAGAIVTKDIPDNSCAAGVPATVKCSIYEYAQKSRDCLYAVSEYKQEGKAEYLKKHVK